MVNRSRVQSTESPSRFIWPRIAPPDSAFHCQTRSTNVSRPRSWRDSPSCGQLALDHVLGGDAGVVHAGQPQHLVALHPPAADERVLDRVVERVADVQGAGHVRRRDDDAVRLPVAGRVRGEVAAGYPLLVPTLLYLARGVLGGQGGFGQHVWVTGHGHLAESTDHAVRQRLPTHTLASATDLGIGNGGLLVAEVGRFRWNAESGPHLVVGPFLDGCPAASYSPTPFPVQYHRRWWA